jgi:hypothetical protein
MRREPAVPASTVLSCLSCGGPDRLSRVDAVVREQRTTTVVHGEVTGQYGYAVPVRAHAVHTSFLASALGPPRRPRPAAGLAVLAALATLGAAGNLETVVASGGARGTTGAVVTGLLAVAGSLLVRARSRDVSRSRILAGRAIWLWKRCWYCHRCGVVSLFTPNGSTPLAADALAPALLDLASDLVWRPRSVRRSTAEFMALMPRRARN